MPTFDPPRALPGNHPAAGASAKTLHHDAGDYSVISSNDGEVFIVNNATGDRHWRSRFKPSNQARIIAEAIDRAEQLNGGRR